MFRILDKRFSGGAFHLEGEPHKPHPTIVKGVTPETAMQKPIPVGNRGGGQS
jgi:hypothetical protein